MSVKLFDTLNGLTQPNPGDKYASCQVGHKVHNTIMVHRELKGQPKIQDLPPIPDRLAVKLDLHVYDWRSYFKVGNDNVPHQRFDEYCTGQDIISYCIDEQGIWEGHDTLVILDLLTDGVPDAGVVLDFGSHVGYYTTLAAIAGYHVAAVDASSENLSLVGINAGINNVFDKVTMYKGWVDKSATIFPADLEEVHFLKCDVEGAEKHVVDMCQLLWKARKIKYALIEISPVFNDSYPALVDKIVDCGYRVYQIPGKGFEQDKLFSERPLETLQRYCEVPRNNRQAYVAGLHQENFLFIRDDSK